MLSWLSCRYEELRYWYDCLCYEEDLRKYHDYIAAMEEMEHHGPRRHYEVPVSAASSSLEDVTVHSFNSFSYFNPLPQSFSRLFSITISFLFKKTAPSPCCSDMHLLSVSARTSPLSSMCSLHVIKLHQCYFCPTPLRVPAQLELDSALLFGVLCELRQN